MWQPLLLVKILLIGNHEVASFIMPQSKGAQRGGISKATQLETKCFSSPKLSLVLQAQPQTFDSYANPHQHGSLALTPEQEQELARVIYEFRDQVQYYYEAKLNELNNILDQIQELQRLQCERQQQSQYQMQSTFDGNAMNAKQHQFLPLNPQEGYHVMLPLDPQLQEYFQLELQVPSNYENKKKKLRGVPAKYYQKTLPAIRPNPAPGMPITAGDAVFANLKASQPILVAKLESMLPAMTKSQPVVMQEVVFLKKNAPILTAEFETTVSTLLKQVAVAQPLLAAEWEAVLTQTIQNQALLTAEISQLLVDAKAMLATYLTDMGACGVDGCDSLM